MESTKYCAYNKTQASYLNLRMTVLDFDSASIEEQLEGVGRVLERGIWIKPWRESPALECLRDNDLIFLDEANRVVEVVESAPELKSGHPEIAVASALALPPRAIVSSQTQRGDELLIWANETIAADPVRKRKSTVVARGKEATGTASAKATTTQKAAAAEKNARVEAKKPKAPEGREKAAEAESKTSEKTPLGSRIRTWARSRAEAHSPVLSVSIRPVSLEATAAAEPQPAKAAVEAKPSPVAAAVNPVSQREARKPELPAAKPAAPLSILATAAKATPAVTEGEKSLDSKKVEQPGDGKGWVKQLKSLLPDPKPAEVTRLFSATEAAAPVAASQSEPRVKLTEDSKRYAGSPAPPVTRTLSTVPTEAVGRAWIAKAQESDLDGQIAPESGTTKAPSLTMEASSGTKSSPARETASRLIAEGLRESEGVADGPSKTELSKALPGPAPSRVPPTLTPRVDALASEPLPRLTARPEKPRPPFADATKEPKAPARKAKRSPVKESVGSWMSSKAKSLKAGIAVPGVEQLFHSGEKVKAVAEWGKDALKARKRVAAQSKPAPSTARELQKNRDVTPVPAVEPRQAAASAPEAPAETAKTSFWPHKQEAQKEPIPTVPAAAAPTPKPSEAVAAMVKKSKDAVQLQRERSARASSKPTSGGNGQPQKAAAKTAPAGSPKKNYREPVTTSLLRWMMGTPKPAPRYRLPGLIAYFWTGGVSEGHPVENISASGLFLRTKERWMPETILLMHLQRTTPNPDGKADSIPILSKVIWQGEHGVGLQFVTPDAKNIRVDQMLPPVRTNKVTVEKFLERAQKSQRMGAA
jgi:hypothetical protein